MKNKNIYDAIDEMEKEVAAEETQEDTTAEEVVEPAIEEAEEVEEESEEEAAEEEADEPEEESDEEEEDLGLSPKENKAWANMRHKLKAAEKGRKKETAEREKLQEQLQGILERQAKTEGYYEAMQKNQAPEAVTAPAEPDKDLYPDEWNTWKIAQQGEQIQTLATATQEQNVAIKMQNEQRGIDILESRYKSTNKDYDDALSFVREKEASLIKFQYPTATDEQINQHLDNEKLNLFRRIAETNKNPAEAVFNMAKAYGFDGKSKPAKPSVKKLNKNMKKSASLIGSADAEPGQSVTASSIVSKSILEATPEDFAQAIENAENGIV
jgi:hypothetical protein